MALSNWLQHLCECNVKQGLRACAVGAALQDQRLFEAESVKLDVMYGSMIRSPPS